MSTNSEGNSTSSEGNNSEITLEKLQAQIATLTTSLEGEKKSKERILNESKEYKDKYLTYKTKEDDLLASKVRDDEERLLKDGKYKVLLEQRDETIKALQGDVTQAQDELNNSLESVLNLKKASAFEKAIGGKMRKGAYWDHVNFKDIAVNPDTGAIDTGSLEKVANSFVKDYKELVDFGRNGNMPNNTAQGSGKLTYEAWQKLSLNDRKKRMKDVI